MDKYLDIPDHSTQLNLDEDDHTQYVLANGTRPMDSLAVDGLTLVVDAATDRVGIGTNTPSETLQVVGDVECFDISTNTAIVNGDLEVSTNVLFADALANKVGVGTNSLSGVLSVDGTATNTGISIGAAYPSWLGANGLYSSGRCFFETGYLSNNDRGINWSNSRTKILGFSDAEDSGNHYLRLETDNNLGLYQDHQAFVGLGTDSPGHRLDVNGNARVSDDLIVDTDTLYVDSTNGRVGIGTDTPINPLEIVAPSTDLLHLRANSSATGTRVGLKLTPSTSPFTPIGGRIDAIRTNIPNTGSTDLSFLTYGSGSLNEAMRVYSSGDVSVAGGLKIASPTVPASATATGDAGDIAWDSDYIYVCVGTNTWKRSALSTW